MTDANLFASSPKELALPRNLSGETAIVDRSAEPALSSIMNISLDMRLTQVAVIVDPGAQYVDISTYGDPKLADELCAHPHQGELLLANPATHNQYGTDPRVLLVLRIPPRMRIATARQFQGFIGIGGIRSDNLKLDLKGTTRLYVECVHNLDATVNADSIATVGTVTGDLQASTTINSRFTVTQAFGHVAATARGSSVINIRGGVGTSGTFKAHARADLIYGGTIAGDAIVENHGTGMLTVREVYGHCKPHQFGDGVTSVNCEVYEAA